ncbi:unnamed protein product [marine sediment metagenome]|uniref:NAD-dependent epimerase/dehydratase domain-containing protein n=1 Tax=marine sediment metagenome TaxID=412755 RepID=X0TCD3_9ZZZZ
MMRKVIVTGGAGFIGSHLVDRLVEKGHDVLVLDNLSSGCMENLAVHTDNSKLQVVEVDIANFQDIKDYFKDVTWVFHLAALADVVPSIQNPLKYHAANVDGTISVLEAARNAGVKRFMYAASSSCYGIADKYPTPETALIRLEYPYALTKYLGEQYVLHWGKVYDLPVVSLRLFNVYGPRVRTSGAYGAVFGVFLAQKINNKPFTVVGDGTQARDFTFVTDIADAFIMAAESDIKNEVLNAGSGDTYIINYLAELLGGDVVHIPKRPGEPDCTYADISKIRKLLGWNPKVSFEEGVKVMLDNIDYWKDAPLWTPETISEVTREWFECLSK